MKKNKIIYFTLISILVVTGTFIKPLFKKPTQKSPYPSSVRSAEVRIVAKKNIEKRKVTVHNRTQKPIYVAIDCNYRTQIGGGYERRSNPRKVWVGRTETFFAYAPKGEEIAVRWTPENPKWFKAKPMTAEEAKKFEAEKVRFMAQKKAMEAEKKKFLEAQAKRKWYQPLLPKKTKRAFKEEAGKKLTEEQLLARTLENKKDFIQAIREADWYETAYTPDKNVNIYIYKQGRYNNRPSPDLKKANILKFIKQPTTRPAKR